MACPKKFAVAVAIYAGEGLMLGWVASSEFGAALLFVPCGEVRPDRSGIDQREPDGHWPIAHRSDVASAARSTLRRARGCRLTVQELARL